jgi:hypothetical protein
MKPSIRTVQECLVGLCIFGSTLGFVPVALSQEIEPNNTCPTAQDVGLVTLPLTLEGELMPTVETPADVDFFRFTGTPGSAVRVDLEGQDTGQGTLADPLVGVLDSNCNFLVTNDDSGGIRNSRVGFTVPSDGIFIVAATSFPDFGFTGGDEGTYQLSLTPADGIRGRVVDADTGAPLPGDVFPFAFVRLLRCEASGCFDVAGQNADSEGRFQFITDFNGQLLVTGTYQIIASANEYREFKTAPFAFEEGEDLDVGDIPLRSVALIQFTDIQSCGDLPPEGGQCRYSVRISNLQSVPVQGAAWSIVEGFGVSPVVDFTRFQPQLPRPLTLDPEESSVVSFEFQVPSTVRDNATICTQVFVGQGDIPFFAPVGRRDLFCFTKGITGFSVLSEAEGNSLRQQGKVRAVISPKKQGFQEQWPAKQGPSR